MEFFGIGYNSVEVEYARVEVGTRLAFGRVEGKFLLEAFAHELGKFGIGGDDHAVRAETVRKTFEIGDRRAGLAAEQYAGRDVP